MNKLLFEKLALLPRDYPGLMKIPQEVIYLMGCRSFDQFCCTARAIVNAQRFCPFCETEMHRRGRKILATTSTWLLISNEFPHKNTERMLLVIPKDHLVDISELDSQNWSDLGWLINQARHRYKMPDGGIMWRFGDPRFNAGTVEHGHINLIKPIPGKEYRPPFAKNEDEHAEDYERVRTLRDQLCDKGNQTWLFSHEGIEETQPKIPA